MEQPQITIEDSKSKDKKLQIGTERQIQANYIKNHVYQTKNKKSDFRRKKKTMI